MNKKRRIVIREDNGDHIMAAYLPSDSTEYEDGDFSGLCALGINNLAGASFARSILYWSHLENSDLSRCNFEEVDFRGSNLKNCNFAGASLKGARLGPDSLGGVTRVQGADFSSANLEGTDFTLAEYNEATKFPVDFDPAAHGMSHAG